MRWSKLANAYRITNGSKFRLKDFDPAETGKFPSKKHAKDLLEKGIVHAGRGSKATHVADSILTPMWEDKNRIFESTISLVSFHKCLMEFNGMGSFMAGQVVCDTKYTRLLDTALDWWQWACPGPGSERGLNRVMGRPVGQRWKECEWFVALQRLLATVGPLVTDAGMPPLHAQDLQNCLCEFDKYERVRLGEGKPRSKYAGT